jgi:hypothetical protein
MFIAADGTTSDADKAQAIADALIDAEDSPARFSAAASLLRAGMARLPLDADTEDKALLFARANIAAGEPDEAIRWITPPEPEVPEIIVPVMEEDTPATDSETAEENPEETAADELPEEALAPEPVAEPLGFDAAWIHALAVLSDVRADDETVEDAANMLMMAAQIEDRTDAAARMFALWAAAGLAPPSQARAFLSLQSPSEDASSAPGDAIAIWAAARSGTAAEVILRSVALTNGDASELGLTDITLILGALQAIGADDAARLLALEATGYWKETP